MSQNPYYRTSPLGPEKNRIPMEEQPIEKPAFFRVFWICRELWKLVLLTWQSKASKKKNPLQSARAVRVFLESLGGMWMKMGQVLAMRTDLFSLEFCTELSRLQDRAITFSPQRSKEIIETEIGSPIDEIFDRFEKAPFAAASLSQVHKARLRKSGKWVAVKVQRPFAADYFYYDHYWLSLFARCLSGFQFLKGLNLKGMVHELRVMMEEELDYRHEAGNLLRLGKILRKHRIIAPKVYAEYSTDRVLVMEFLEGVFMSDWIKVLRTDPERASAWLVENEIDPRIVAQELFQSLMRQFYEDLFFHGDLHPGNILLMKENRFAFIDFGNCGEIDSKLALHYSLYFRAMAEQELEKAADLLLITMGRLPPMDVQAFKKQVIKALKRQTARSHMPNLPYREKSIGRNAAELNQIMAEHKIEVNWDMLKMARAFEALDQNLATLNPNFDFTRQMRRYQTRVAIRRQQHQMQHLRKFLMHIGDVSQIVLPSLLQQSHQFSGGVDKGIQVVAGLFKIIRMGLFLLLILGIDIFLNQYFDRVISPIEDPLVGGLAKQLGIKQVMDAFPKLPPHTWFFIGAILLIILWQFSKFIRRLLKPDEHVVRVTRVG